MKTLLSARPLLIKIILLFACFILATFINSSKASETPVAANNYNRVAVNFIHDAEKNELTISLKGASEAIMQLFIFSADGILIREVEVSTHSITTIKGLKRGYYFYDCFNNDQRIKRGNLLIK